MTRVGWLLTLAAASAVAAETIGGPIAGYVAGAKPELRAIGGVPGSFVYSEPVTLPEGTRRVRVAPGQEFAVAELREGPPQALVLRGGAVDHATALDGVMAAADWVAFSLGARAAVFYSAAGGRLQVVTGLPDTPQVAIDTETAAFAEEPVTAAVSDDGSLVLAASARSVFVVRAGAAPRLILSGTRIRSVAVLRNGVDAVVGDDGTGSVHLVTAAGSTAAERVLASGLYLLGDLVPSADGATLYVARPGARSIAWIDLASGAVQSVEADVPLSGLTALRNRDTFLISARPLQPGWVFYRDGEAGRVVFIPAIARRVPESEQ